MNKMREHIYFNQDDHTKHVQIIESILMDTEKLIDDDIQSITMTYEQMMVPNKLLQHQKK